MAAISGNELQVAWQKVKAMTSLPEPPEPKLPSFGPKVSMNSKLHTFQNVITSLEYNYTGTLYFDVNKNRSFKSIASTAKEILREGLPIQCLEAVFLAAYLTAGIKKLDRFPVSFKTTAGATTHRHIVLGIQHQQRKWGALGLSRCDKLMDKDLKFDTLGDLILEYCHEFENVYHQVLKVNIGFPLTHDIHSSERVEWRVFNIQVYGNSWTEVSKQLDGFGKDAAEIYNFKKSTGTVHIVITPIEIIIKKPISSNAPAPPTNIFLQNTSPTPLSIKIEDKSGFLEIVTKLQPNLLLEKSCQTDKCGQSSSTFYLSAGGMIVVALKFNGNKRTSSLIEPIQTKLIKKGGREIQGSDMSFDGNYVLFSCKPMICSFGGRLEVLSDAETVTLERPFFLKEI
ncbi:Vasohibin [Plasmopara halstedii]|uniref:Vasohibin n=1 Tax=Plasmopara halstedii TaxID=4781 RepID=A0A0P1AFS3_PLAHL|nr:Vasohibin [Plasmopara halstedii]CEG39933.1 Vasohibin [Plasmopara halstedii]|eukprot:XP_024576302.1 Vasohibin [Plasmopara halstedii]